MASFRGLVGTLIVASLLSGCSSEDFNLSKLASTTVSGFTEKLGGLSLVKLGEKVGIRTDPKVKLDPAPLPIYAIGDTFVYSSDGTIVQEQVVNVNSGRVTWTNDQGAMWTTTNDIITPQLSWSSHPELGRGRQTLIGNPEALFPLKENNTVSFGIRGNSENVPTGWRDEKKCLVVGQKDLNVTAGDYTTFQISCNRKGIKEDLYYSPVVQNYVLRVRDFGKTKSQKELVSVQLSNARISKLPVKINRPKEEHTAKLKKLQANPDLLMDRKEIKTANAKVNALIAKLETMISKIESNIEPAQKENALNSTQIQRNGKYGVHLASYRTLNGAKRGWKKLKKKFSNELRGLKFATTEFDAGKKGTFIRLMAVPFKTKENANNFCKKLKAKRQYCKGERARP